MNNLRAYFYLSLKRINARGEAPVYCRVSLSQNIRSDFSTGIFLRPDEWDRKRCAPMDNAKCAIVRLSEIQKNVYAIISECENKSVYSPSEIVKKYRFASQKTVYSLVNVARELMCAERVSEESKRKLSIATSQFVNICGNNLYGVTTETIRGFVNEASKTFSPVTVKKKLEFIKRVFTYAFNRGYILRNPFAGFRMPTLPRLVHVQLTDAELCALQKKELHCKRLDQVRDLFVLQCFTGLSYSDLVNFRREMMEARNGVLFLSGERSKTRNRFMLPMEPEAVSIAEKYNYALPVLSNQKYNAYLKEIADLCRITKKLTTHVGRKTFSQRMIDKGYSAEAVSFMMGHASFNMTQKHYGRIGEMRIEQEALKMAI